MILMLKMKSLPVTSTIIKCNSKEPKSENPNVHNDNKSMWSSRWSLDVGDLKSHTEVDHE